MNAPDRAAVIAANRRALDIAEAGESLPLPMLLTHKSTICFFTGYQDAPRVMAALENALAEAGPFTGAISSDGRDYVLTGSLGGVPVKITGPAAYVAEKRVTGTTVVEQVEWVRLPPRTAAVRGPTCSAPRLLALREKVRLSEEEEYP